MMPGVDVDALVAEQVMGWRWITLGGTGYLVPPDHLYFNQERRAYYGEEQCDQYWAAWFRQWLRPPMPRFSTEMSSAWGVVEKITTADPPGRSFDLWRRTDEGAHWWAAAFDGDAGEPASTAPLAICLAALKACGVKVPA